MGYTLTSFMMWFSPEKAFGLATILWQFNTMNNGFGPAPGSWQF